ncbi:alpha/beta fold hydrolase [Pseudonocardia sp. ICBG601]|uniref:alpha/beta fold hydrolase n=1 Tax=Pseudonocardia sp. ICBG601 TaxID=2846759 RepID=UPI001CF6DECC|nr:alpha/beta hydrolase [Pseudonocardia sp. ICBG601]
MELPSLDAPTLVLHGTADQLTPVENGVRLAGRIPGAHLTLFDGARHAYFLERREEASVAVVDFLDSHSDALD